VADGDLPFLKGRISMREGYRSPRRGGGERQLPPRNAREHARALRRQLDGLARAAAARAAMRDPDASREIVAVSPEDGYGLDAQRLGDRRSDLRVIGMDPQTGNAILDARDARLEPLAKKVAEYEDPARVSRMTGLRRNEAAVGPITAIHLASLDDLIGPRLRADPPPRGEQRWFEVGCRGGRRRPDEEIASSRAQVRRQLHQMGHPQPRDFVATEQVFFFVRLTLEQLRALIEAVDCCYEVDLAGPRIRDWLFHEEYPRREPRGFDLTPPPADAPAVVLLDTGIRRAHPLLHPAVLTADSVLPGDDSPEDQHRHGTEMAGVALYGGRLGEALDAGGLAASHWLQSVRVIDRPREGPAAEEQREWWPLLTENAVLKAEEANRARPRSFALAVTARADDSRPTLWSHAIDQLAFNSGSGRLLCVSAGNAEAENPALLAGYPALNLEARLQEPAQAFNALTIGAFTSKATLPADRAYEDARIVAPAWGISPSTSAGEVRGDPRKPDVVFEGGNVAISGELPDVFVPTLVTLTTGLEHLTRPLSLFAQTSEATARAARLGAQIWTADRSLRAETVRGLIVHAASWTPEMRQQFPNRDELLAACGLGVPDEPFAASCRNDAPTVIVEDGLANAVASEDEDEARPTREVKTFRMPIPDGLADLEDAPAELRITLSYFAEPNLYRRTMNRGLDLAWDLQRPGETEGSFLERVNDLRRGQNWERPGGGGLAWALGPQRRARGTVQSDRWEGRAALLAGAKLIAVVPVLGWWDRRPELKYSTTRFSLIVTLRVPGVDVYLPIAQALELVAEVEV
jgi:hypothetical protein